MGPLIWITGVPVSGKTTLAKKLAAALGAAWLDGGLERQKRANDDFSEEGRRGHVEHLAYMAVALAKARQAPVIVACVSPHAAHREAAYALARGEGLGVFEVHTTLEVDVAMARDKGKRRLYERASRGNLENLSGYNGPYDVPEHPDCVVPTDELDADAACQLVLTALERRWPKSSS